MQKLVGWLMRAVLEYVSLWVDRKRAEYLEVKVKMLESETRAREAEARIKAAAEKIRPDVVSPSAWNAGRVVPLIIVLVMLSGCRWFHDRFPIIEMPARPKVPVEPIEWTQRETLITEYAGRLESEIEAYNEHAKAHNKKAGYKP